MTSERVLSRIPEQPISTELGDKTQPYCNGRTGYEFGNIQAALGYEIVNDESTDEVKPLIGSNKDRKIVGDENDSAKKGAWRNTTCRQKFMLTYVSGLNFLYFVCIDASTPFLARVVSNRGGSRLLSTLILQVSMVTMAVSCLVFAKYQTRIGSKRLILVGQIFFCLCQIGFGAIGYFNNVLQLVVVGILLRAIQGVCQAALSVGGLTIVCQEFSDYISTVFGIFEGAYGAGALTSPYLGGFLYDLSGGMMLPMGSTGLFTMAFSMLGFVVLPKNDASRDNIYRSYLQKILFQPRAIFIIGVAGTINGGFSLCVATITMYLKPKGFSATRVGQLLFLMGMCYCVFAMITGKAISGRIKLRRFLMTSGLLVGVAAPLVFTPNQTDSWIYAAAFAFATSTVLVFISSFDELLFVLTKDVAASDVDLSLHSAISGIWTASVALGSFIVPVVGSVMEGVLPFWISFEASIISSYGATMILALVMAAIRKTRMGMLPDCGE